MHTHGNVLASLDPLEKEIGKYLRYERLVHPLRILHTLPLSHVFGQFMGLWVPPLLVMASATVLAAALLSHLLGGPMVSLATGKSLISAVGGPGPFLVGMLVAGPLSEEPGWRGTAYPRMRASLGRLQAGLLLGVVWAVWHLPLFFVTGTLQAGFGLISWSGLLFVLSIIPMALLTGCAYERAGVAASMAVHFGVNATIALLGASSPTTLAFMVAVQLIVAVTLIASQREPRADRPVHVDPHLARR